MLQELVARGVRVPEDLALVGYDDNEFAEASLIPLTSMPPPPGRRLDGRRHALRGDRASDRRTRRDGGRAACGRRRTARLRSRTDRAREFSPAQTLTSHPRPRIRHRRRIPVSSALRAPQSSELYRPIELTFEAADLIPADRTPLTLRVRHEDRVPNGSCPVSGTVARPTGSASHRTSRASGRGRPRARMPRSRAGRVRSRSHAAPITGRSASPTASTSRMPTARRSARSERPRTTGCTRTSRCSRRPSMRSPRPASTSSASWSSRRAAATSSTSRA